MASIIPESAPFNEEQRAWLNGFFAGLMGMQTTSPDTNSEAMAASISATVTKESEEEDLPWHDASLTMDDRMALADNKPLKHKLMAAMAQLDCGSCGYICQTYSEAIASGEETNLTLCSPGGKETKQMLKRVLADSGSDEPSSTVNPAANGKDTQERALVYSRANPFEATLLESRRLNKEGSDKDTRHVVIDLTGSGLRYTVGDALGVYPRNCGELVRKIISKFKDGDETAIIQGRTGPTNLLDVLSDECCLKDPSDELLQLLAEKSEGKSQQELQSILRDGAPDGCDVLDMLELAGEIEISPREFASALEPLNPRLYSIASSNTKFADQVHLTVGKVTYERSGRIRKGVASTMMADRIRAGEKVRIYIQPNRNGFTIPQNPETPMIMVGPGTGIAPFIAFLQERAAIHANGKNWLFFGDQHQAYDFLYEDELKDFQQVGLLSRLDTAFSRDGDTKIYVQDRMREAASELWNWIESGAVFYVCGDALRMSKDVDFALKEIISQQANVSPDEAVAYVKGLEVDGRYHRDVY